MSMTNQYYEIEPFKAFSQSKIWEINKNYYQSEGLNAWRDGTVPHHLTSNSVVGRTYAQLILGHLKDMAQLGSTKETVYIVELGAGHGRLGYHVLKHLEKLLRRVNIDLPSYCYILTDIAENNLDFFLTHPQFQYYFNNGTLDVAYFDATCTDTLRLRYAGREISTGSLNQSLITVANYFFDSIPTDVFLVKNQELSELKVSIRGTVESSATIDKGDFSHLDFTFLSTPIDDQYYDNTQFNDILESYRLGLEYSHVFFPKAGLECLDRLRALTNVGLMVLSIDKGFHELKDIDKVGQPDVVTHGSVSIWVNFHSIGSYCSRNGGQSLFSDYATLHLDCACFLMTAESDAYHYTKSAFQEYVNDYGPDDFYAIKQLTYSNINALSLIELITLIRVSYYDSTLFQTILPRLKQLTQEVTLNERRRLGQCLNQIWEMYYSIEEPFDLAYAIGGLFYDLGFYTDAKKYFEHSISLFGLKSDCLHNIALCQYQLREDQGFLETLKSIRSHFPQYTRISKLDNLNLELS